MVFAVSLVQQIQRLAGSACQGVGLGQNHCVFCSTPECFEALTPERCLALFAEDPFQIGNPFFLGAVISVHPLLNCLVRAVLPKQRPSECSVLAFAIRHTAGLPIFVHRLRVSPGGKKHLSKEIVDDGVRSTAPLGLLELLNRLVGPTDAFQKEPIMQIGLGIVRVTSNCFLELVAGLVPVPFTKVGMPSDNEMGFTEVGVESQGMFRNREGLGKMWIRE